jgi:hypothetical protein
LTPRQLVSALRKAFVFPGSFFEQGDANLPESPRWGTGYDGGMIAEGKSVPIGDSPRVTKGPPLVRSVLCWASSNVGANNADLRLSVEFGVGGFTQSFLADFQNGQQFAIVCNTLRLNVVGFRPNADAPYEVGTGIIKAGAVVAIGSTTRGQPLYLSEARITLDAADDPPPANTGESYAVPPLAKRFRVNVIGNDDPAVDTLVNFIFEYGGGTEMEFDCRMFGVADAWMAIPAGVQFVTVSNDNTGGILGRRRVQLIWELAL